MGSMQKEEQQIARIRIIAKVDFLPATISFVREVSTKLGLASNDAGRLELVVEEACMNVIEHAFDPDEQGSFDIIILRKPGQVAVAVEDQGLPFDFKKLEAGNDSSLGVMLMKAFADEIYFLNLGRGGKRVELIKNLPYKDVEVYLSEEEREGTLSLPPAPKDIPLTIRLMRPDDSVSVSRCMYRCYGYTYSNDYVYFPDRIRDLLESGLLVSYVVLNPDSEIVAHTAMYREHLNAQIGEAVQAVVDPRYRGHGLFKKLHQLLLDHAKGKGMYGAYGEAVTVHPYTQKTSISSGGREVGILLGFTPATMFFKRIQEEHQQQRRTAVLLYTKVNEEPLRDVYPPFHHQTMLCRIYERSKLNRNIRNVPDLKEQVEIPPSSRVDVKVQTGASRAFMRITEYGADLDELVRFRLRELCLRRIDCIYLDLPLSHPATPKFCASLEMLGFFFAGIIPEMFDGDALRLQYLNNVDIDLEEAQLASDFGKELLAYVIQAKGP